MEFEKWADTELQYELKEIASGIFVYMYKKIDNSTKPKHWLCPYCFEKRKKIFLLNVQQALRIIISVMNVGLNLNLALIIPIILIRRPMSLTLSTQKLVIKNKNYKKIYLCFFSCFSCLSWLIAFLSGLKFIISFPCKKKPDLDSIDAKIVRLNRKAKLGREFINFLYHKPIIKTSDVTKELGISLKSAISLIKTFEEIGILNELTGFKRNSKL
ncbi:hypothetical protein HY745_02460 [Candidatus Desantisbacteria bacterium]|nr:hypothetical protein [Candidatus Desantisbacteria bacterium]